MPTDLSDRVALVTGGARGIGVEVADYLRSLGCRVAVGDLNLPKFERVSGGNTSSHRLDVRLESDCERVVREVVSLHGSLDILVNNAGVMVRGAVEEVSLEDWRRVLDVNVTGALRMSKAALPLLKDRGDGAIVNVASSHVFATSFGVGAYSVSKAALVQLTRVLALEWAEFGIRVNAVAPTVVPTAMNESVLNDEDYAGSKLSGIPLGRMAMAREVAFAVGFLASPMAAMTTGEVMKIDGGETL